MECRDISPHLADYLAGTLPDAELAAIRAHLGGCAGCRDEVEALDDTWQQLGTIAAERADSTAMRARFDAAVAGFEEGAGSARGRVVRPAAGRWWRPQFASAAAAAALLVAGVGIGRMTVTGVAAMMPGGSPPATAATTDAQLAALRDELGEMRQMVTLSLLQQQSASERLRGVTFTSQIAQPGAAVVTALLDALADDPNANVRLASIDALRRFADREVVRQGALAAFARQTSPLVQIALIDFVVEASGSESAATLRRLSADTMLDPAVRARAAAGLGQLGVKS